ILAIKALSDRLPGTIGLAPESASPNALDLTTRRNPPERLLASGPWQAKHLSERIGRISWAKSAGTPATNGDETKAKPLNKSSLAPISRQYHRGPRIGIIGCVLAYCLRIRVHQAGL